MSSVKFKKGNISKPSKGAKGAEVKVEVDKEEGGGEEEKEKEEEKKPVFQLAEEDVEFIYDNTHYTLKDIKDWHRGFAADCPNGKLYRQKVMEVYEEIVPNGNCKFFVDQIFRIFDADANGYLDFKEFLIAIDMSINGSPEEKLRWGFRIFDKDGSGSIDLKEMTRIMTCLLELEGVGRGAAKEKAVQVFNYLDVNSDGKVELKEFVTGSLKDKQLVGMLKRKVQVKTGKDPPPDVCVVVVEGEEVKETKTEEFQ